jgi:hypothetical protein
VFGLIRRKHLMNPEGRVPPLSLAGFLPGVGITGALGWECPVDLQGGRRGALLVLFRVAVLYQIFTRGRRILKEEPGGTEPAQ